MGKLLEFFRPKRDDGPMDIEELLERLVDPREPIPDDMDLCVRVMETADPRDTDVLYVIETSSEWRFHKPTGVRSLQGGAYRFNTVCGKDFLDRSQYSLEFVRSLEPLKVAPIGEDASTEQPFYACERCLPADFIVPLIRLIDRRLVVMVEPTPARLSDLGMTPIDGGREWIDGSAWV